MTSTDDKTWGFLHPDCHGPNALLFFSWDLARTIEEQFKQHYSAPVTEQLEHAQKAVDRLLKQYVQIQANPDAFEGQSITLRLEPDESNDKGVPVLALETTPHLESLLLQMQSQMQQSSNSIN